MMRKLNNFLILIMGILVFLISYSLDAQINLFFKNIRFPVFDVILSVITNFGVVIIVMLVFPSIILYKKNKKLIYFLLLASITSFLLALIAKLIIQRQRPIGLLFYPFVDIIDYSFPSQHSIVVFSLLPLLITHLQKQKHFWIAFAFLVVFSRIYFRFHFLSDVVFGALFGYFIGSYLLELYERGKLWKT